MNDKEVREMLENEKVPEELEPENIKTMLDEKAPAVKRKRISAVTRFAAIAAACAVVSGTAVYVAGQRSNINKKDTVSEGASSAQTGTQAPTEAASQPGSEAASQSTAEAPAENSTQPAEVDLPAPDVKAAAYMTGAEDYSQIYELLSKSYEEYQKDSSRNMDCGSYYLTNGLKGVDMIADEDAEAGDDGAVKATAPQTSGGETEHSDTFDQEDGVLEADIVKTDGKTIYYLGNQYYSYDNECIIRAVEVKDGSFGKSSDININRTLKGMGVDTSEMYISSVQLYLYNDMVIFLGTYSEGQKMKLAYDTNKYVASPQNTVVLAFSSDDSHKLLGSYVQEGWINDVRISPEGYLYVISDYSSCNAMDIPSEENVELFIPHCGTPSEKHPIEAGDILMPDLNIKPDMHLCYSVIGSIDLNTPGSLNVIETKALAGYAGQIYCSADNLYTAACDYSRYWLPYEEVEYGFTTDLKSETEITRIAINGGKIEPAASGKIEGVVNDQFSMSEYNGYFRVAVTCSEVSATYKKGTYYDYEYDDEDDYGIFTETIGEGNSEHEYGYYDYKDSKQDNRLYVLDLDLKEVGSIGGFGIDESVKSVNFNGDMAYVVTYEQTDPLFAIDLSDPSSPRILDEYKMLGYSSYMQRWSDDLLLGFGPDANEEGRVTGIKMVMFDNSDPTDLKQVGLYSLNSDDDFWIYSGAVYDRKAMFIQPEKNLVGFPVSIERYNPDKESELLFKYSYMFFSYEDGRFVPKGEISNEIFYDYMTNNIGYNIDSDFERAVYIGDYIYAISGTGIYSADIDTITVKNTFQF